MFLIFIYKELLMANITNNNFNRLDLKISKSEYWDLILSKQKDPSVILDGSFLYDDMLISCIDVNDNRCVSGSTLYSTPDYKWFDSVNNGLSLSNFGFNGIDNGRVVFDKDSITSDEFFNIVTGTTLEIQTGDTRLILNMVSGNTKDYIYPFSFVSDIHGDYIQLEGGFYQGFFKSGTEYSVLPDIIQNEMSFEFILKPDLVSIPKIGTLNAKYPNNKGIFFYMGVRSENKFWYDYLKEDQSIYNISKTGSTSPFTGETLYTDDNFPIQSQNVYDIQTDNKYLLFNRTNNGQVASSFNKDIEYHITGQTRENLNYYLYMNRTSTGYTASTVDNLTGLTKPYTIIDDIVNNTIAFRIKDDGSVGYRMINKNCTGSDIYSVDEEYSQTNIIKDNEVCFVNVRAIMSTNSQCGDSNRNFKLWFYVNSKLVFVSKELPEIMLRALSDRTEKQESIPYNISFGGGSQGLSDMIGFNTGCSTQYLLPIEENFGGSFIGGIHQFKVYYGKMDYSKINNNYIYQSGHIFSPDYIIPTIDFWLSGLSIEYPETNYKRESGNVGTILNGNIVVNDMLHPVTGYKLYYYSEITSKNQINGLFNMPSTGGTISEYIHNDLSLVTSGLTTLKYIIEVFDTYNDEHGTEQNKTITFDSMIFYGTSNVQPTNSSDIRILDNRLFNSETTEFIMETGNVNHIFTIAVPINRSIVSIFDQTSLMFDVTDFFINNVFDVADGGGVFSPYNVYTMKNSIPYTKNHNFIVTLG